MKKLVLAMLSAGALVVPGAAIADRADGTITLVCTDNATGAVIFSVTTDANAAQGQNQVIQAQRSLLERLGATCTIY
jgi:hypothetical protein